MLQNWIVPHMITDLKNQPIFPPSIPLFDSIPLEGRPVTQHIDVVARLSSEGGAGLWPHGKKGDER
jgi:hypothetical protein